MNKVVRFPTLTHSELSYISDNVLDDEQIEAFVAGLPADQVIAFALGAETVKKQAAAAQKMAESRIVGESLLTTGEVWESPDGREFFWTGVRKRECSDPEQLKSLLLEQSKEWTSVIAKRALLAAFKAEIKTYVSELDRITQHEPAAEPLVQDFVSWKEGPPHLREVEEKPRE